MGAFGELLKVYWGDPTQPVKRKKPVKPSKLELEYEEQRKHFEEGFHGFKEKKIIAEAMGEFHKRRLYTQFMYFEDWLKFTENGKYHYIEVLNKIFDEQNNQK